MIKKITGLEYTRKVSFLIGVHLKIALANWYQDLLVNQLDIPDEVIELRKKIIYQDKYKSNVLTIYSILSRAKEVDKALMAVNL